MHAQKSRDDVGRRPDLRLLEKVRSTRLLLTLYIAWLFILGWMIPPYGDPATNMRLSSNLLRFGFPLDPVSRVVRPPIFYGLLASASLLGIQFLVPPLLTGGLSALSLSSTDNSPRL